MLYRQRSIDPDEPSTPPPWDRTVNCPECHGEGRIAAYGCGDQAGGFADTCQECKGTGRTINAFDPADGTPGIDDIDPGAPPDPDPAPGRRPIWRARAFIGCHDLNMLAQVRPAEFRARLAALTADDLAFQAMLFAIYATDLCGQPIGEAETLEQFTLAADVHRATVNEPSAPHPIVVAADACVESYAGS